MALIDKLLAVKCETKNGKAIWSFKNDYLALLGLIFICIPVVAVGSLYHFIKRKLK